MATVGTFGGVAGAQGDSVPPSGTYTGTFTSGTPVSIPISCTASACTVGLNASLGGPAQLANVGPGHYQATRGYPPYLGRDHYACPIPPSATEDIDLAYGGGEAILTATLNGYETHCESS